MKIFKEIPKVPFVRYRYLSLGISLFLVATSIFLLITRGLNYGTDFLGGVSLQYLFPKPVLEGEVRSLLAESNLGDVSVVRYGRLEDKRLMIKVSQSSQEMENVSQVITPKLKEAFGEGVLLEMEEIVGPKVGGELRRKGILAVLFSIFCMLVYVGFRFDFYFAPGAIVALFHDCLLAVGAISLLQWEFNLTLLAALLTIVGYSINDSIVVFDRIREHARLISPSTLEEVVNTSINETLSRTLLTGLTTLFVVGVLYFFGGATIKGFAFAMMIGILTGTYSTFSIVCPIYILLYRLIPQGGTLFSKKTLNPS